jgi:methionine biosynthesis protein MetW
MMRDTRQEETIKVLTSLWKKLFISSLRLKKYLDLGCGDGSFTLRIADVLDVEEIYGVDINDELLAKASMRGIRVYKANLNTDKLPFADNEFDVVGAFEVIEHLWNTDNMISEVHRVLKQGGLFILTTPNLASWVNRLLLLFGYLPFHYECSIKYSLEKRPLQRTTGVSGHIRLYTFKTLEKHLESYGFRILHSTGYSMAYIKSNFVTRLLDVLFSIRKTLRAGILIIAVKK